MYWYEQEGSENDVVLSTRVRFARNIVKTPFPIALKPKEAEELAEKISALFDREKYTVAVFSKLTAAERGAYVEAHLCSPEFAAEPYDGKRLILSKDGDISVMVGEEDHLRIQVIRPGFDPSKTYERADTLERELSGKLKFAFSERLGYLTCCPTNLGSAMRTSVMLHLPALTLTRGIGKLSGAVSKLGFTVRGMYGEGSEATGMLYQISNVPSAAQNEETIMREFEKIVRMIISSERSARQYLCEHSGAKLADRVGRAYGVMKYAALMSSEEFFKNYSLVRLGISAGILENCRYDVLDRMAVELMPASLCLINADAQDAAKRDEIRATELRKRLK